MLFLFHIYSLYSFFFWDQVAKGCLLRGDDTTVSVTLEVFADLCSVSSKSPVKSVFPRLLFCPNVVTVGNFAWFFSSSSLGSLFFSFSVVY